MSNREEAKALIKTVGRLSCLKYGEDDIVDALDAAEQRGYQKAREQVFNILIMAKKRPAVFHGTGIAALEEINNQIHFMEKK